MKKNIKNSEMRIYITGLFTGIIFAGVIILLLQLLGVIPILFSSSLSKEVSSKVREAESYIDRYYWKDRADNDVMSDFAVKGMMYALGDKYSMYYSKKEYEELMSDVEGVYIGIGVAIEYDEATMKKTLTKIKENSPAQKAGVLEGDILTHIDGIDVTKKNLSETADLIKEKDGQKVELVVIRTKEGKTEALTLQMTTQRIVNQSVRSKMLEETVGYIRITEFDNQTEELFRTQLSQLEKKNQKGLIIDLRDNGGGTLTAVIDIVNQLMAKGTIMTEKRKTGDTTVYSADDEEHFDKPLVVLINGSSASASEVMAGALKDNKKATLVGEQSYGKGIMQGIFKMKYGGGIKLTTGEYLLPSGVCIHEKGIAPDEEIKYTGTSKVFGDADDNQLQRAIRVLKEKIAG